MMKLKPLLDSYYAPHEKHSRFWPGLLLLVRCGLFVVFSLDYIHGSHNTLVTVTITFIINSDCPCLAVVLVLYQSLQEFLCECWSF